MIFWTLLEMQPGCIAVSTQLSISGIAASAVHSSSFWNHITLASKGKTLNSLQSWVFIVTPEATDCRSGTQTLRSYESSTAKTMEIRTSKLIKLDTRDDSFPPRQVTQTIKDYPVPPDNFIQNGCCLTMLFYLCFFLNIVATCTMR